MLYVEYAVPTGVWLLSQPVMNAVSAGVACSLLPLRAQTARTRSACGMMVAHRCPITITLTFCIASCTRRCVHDPYGAHHFQRVAVGVTYVGKGSLAQRRKGSRVQLPLANEVGARTCVQYSEDTAKGG